MRKLLTVAGAVLACLVVVLVVALVVLRVVGAASRALASARAISSGVMSSPITRPVGPTLRAASQQSMPAPGGAPRPACGPCVAGRRHSHRLRERRRGGQAGQLHVSSCRHSFASWYMMRGGSLTALQQILGHATLNMTLRYAHLSPSHLRDEMAKTEKVASPSVNGTTTAHEVDALIAAEP